jgi:diaminopimelate decarboxylase
VKARFQTPDSTSGFRRVGGELTCDGVPLAAIAARFGTPTYVYSGAAAVAALGELRAGLGATPHQICYAVKANGNLALLELLAAHGASFDAGSVGELARVLVLSIDPSRLIFSGVGKRDDELVAALEAGVRYVGVESRAELEALARLGAERGRAVPVCLRVNPDVDAQTHPYISTGLAENKFGIPHDEAFELADWARQQPGLDPCGVSCHIGSQITTLEPFRDAARRMAAIAGSLLRRGLPLRFVGVGGGLGIRYAEEEPPSPAAYGAALGELLGPTGLTVVVEPGRAIVGSAGALLASVVRVKRGADRSFLVIDAGMNDLIRPALYGAHHGVEPVSPTEGEPAPFDVVGPVCESSDTFGRGRLLPPLAEGAVVALLGAGAYGFTMASTYNGRPRPAEVLVHEGQALLAREREGVVDLWRGEHRLDGSAAPAVLPGALRSKGGKLT